MIYGNNFATTEAEITDMGLRLAGAGSQIGLTEGEILGLATALSSVGIEAQAGGSAFSKVMIEMQLAVETGNSSLKDFANVSGMTTKEFQKSFKNNAAGAINSFIVGLSKMDEQGVSSIKTLNDMGIKEVRLRDTLLRASNAQELFTDAVKVGNAAWRENSALTNEVTKRYQTTESQMKIAQNQIKNISTTLGNNLLPHINKVLNNITLLTQKFDKLSEEEQGNILKTLALVAAIGPAIKILGTLGTGISTVSKGVGTFTKSISLMQNGIGTATGASANLAKGLTALTSPAGLVTIAIAGITAGVLAYKNSLDNAIKETEKFSEETLNYIKSINDVALERNKQTQSDLAHIENTKALYGELKTLVDVNGKIKDGYKDRANFITNELSKALGIEIKTNDGIIQSYKDIQDEIDKTILKKQAEIILNAAEKDYTEAYEKKTEVYHKLTEATDELNKKQQKLNEVEEKYLKYKDSYTGVAGWLNAYYADQKKNLEEQVHILQDTKDGVQVTLDEMLDDIVGYQHQLTIAESGTTEELKELVTQRTTLYKTDVDGQKISSEEQIRLLAYQLDHYQQYYNNLNETTDTELAEIHKQHVENNKRSLDELANNLLAQTNTVNENSDDIVNSWKALAENSKSTYQETLAPLPEDLRRKIEEMTGVAYSENEAMATSFARLALNSKDEFEAITTQMPEKMKNNIVNIANSVNSNGGKVTDETKDLMENVLKELDKEESGKTKGTNLVEGINKGIQNQSAQTKVLGTASSLANKILSRFSTTWDEHSPSKKTEGMAINLLKGMPIGWRKEENKTVKEAEKVAGNILDAFSLKNNLTKLNDMQGTLNQQIVDSTRMIYTTPNIVFNVQEMNDQNLDKAFNYINRRFGSQY